jgi:hypothetical protein
LNDWGNDVSVFMTEYVGVSVAELGTIIGVIIAAAFAFMLIRKAMAWARSGF